MRSGIELLKAAEIALKQSCRCERIDSGCPACVTRNGIAEYLDVVEPRRIKPSAIPGFVNALCEGAP